MHLEALNEYSHNEAVLVTYLVHEFEDFGFVFSVRIVIRRLFKDDQNLFHADQLLVVALAVFGRDRLGWIRKVFWELGAVRFRKRGRL